MPPVTLTAVVDLSKIKMKWKETYVSEGLNRKVIPAMPRGVYRGLRLVQNISSPRQVQVSATPDTLHAAIHESATGFSTTYHDVAGGSTILDLSSASLDNQETVVALSIVYVIGADTTASWIAYPIADWNALTDAQRAEKIVVGTVNVPAPATNITTAMITMKRRSWAWENAAGDMAWSPLLKNTGFEHAEVNGTYTNAASFWTFVPGANALWKVQQTDPRTGISALAMDHTVAGAQTASFFQAVGASVLPGQLVKYQLFIKNLKVAVGGSLQIWLRFLAPDWVTETTTTIVIPMTSLDATYREISDTVAVPAGCVQFVSAHIQHTLNQGTTGVSFRIDDFQVFLQSTPEKPAGTEGRVRQHINTDQVIFEDANDYFLFYYGNAALMRQSVDELIIERRDQNRTASNPVNLALPTTRITRLGEDLLNTEARALLPRITAGVSITGGVEFTLMWQSVPSGQPGYRKYISAAGAIVETVNASWSGTGWVKDVGGVAAIKRSLGAVEHRVDQRLAANNSTWADGSWDQTSFSHSFGSSIAQFVASLNIFGDLWLSNGAHITLNGTGKYKRGSRVRIYDGLSAELISYYPSVYDRNKIDFFSGTSLLFFQESGQQFRLPIELEEDEQLTEVRAYSYNGATDVMNMKLYRQTITVGASLAGTTAQVGATQTSVNHSNIIEQLTISGIGETATVSGATGLKSWSVELGNPVFASGPICAGIAVFTTVP